MPVKKHLQEAKAVADVGGAHAPAVGTSVAPTGFEYATPRTPDRPQETRIDSLDHISAHLRPELNLFQYNARFPWCKQPTGFHWEFTRFYFTIGVGERGPCVLLDMFAADTNTARKEVAFKREQIEAENERRAQRGLPPIGYLPVVRGATITTADDPERGTRNLFAAVKAGDVLDLVAHVDPMASIL